MSSSLLDVGKYAVLQAQRLGVGEVDCYVTEEREIEVYIENNEVKICKSQEMRGIGVRVLSSCSLGYASSNSHLREDVGSTVQQASRISSMTPPDPANRLPDVKKAGVIEGLFDPAVDEVRVEDAVRLAGEMLKVARGYDPRVTVDSGNFGVSSYRRGVVSGNGVEVEELGSSFVWSIMGMASDGGEVSSFDVQVGASRSLKNVDTSKAALEFAKNVVSSLGARRAESFKGEVLFSPEATSEVLLSPILHSVNSKSVQKGMSRFASKIGERVASEHMTLVDDGTVKGGLLSSSFDREGIPHRRLELLGQGVLRSYLYNTYSAVKDRVESTGHASGSYRSVPSIGHTNLFLKPGEVGVDELTSGLKRGLLVTRFSGNVNPVSGDFSGVVKGGKYVENGDVKHPLKETLIAGNAYDLLLKVTAASKEIKELVGASLPHVKVAEVSVTSG